MVFMPISPPVGPEGFLGVSEHLSNEKQRKVFHSWAPNCGPLTKCQHVEGLPGTKLSPFQKVFIFRQQLMVAHIRGPNRFLASCREKNGHQNRPDETPDISPMCKSPTSRSAWIRRLKSLCCPHTRNFVPVFLTPFTTSV